MKEKVNIYLFYYISTTICMNLTKQLPIFDAVLHEARDKVERGDICLNIYVFKMILL